MKQRLTFTSLALGLLTAVLCSAPVTTQSPVTDWNVGDVFVGVGNFDVHTGKYLVYSPQGVLKEQVVDPTAASVKVGRLEGITTGCMVAPSDNGYDDALYTTTFYTNRLMRFASAHPHTATLAATASHPNLEAIESVIFDNQGNYYVGGLPPARESAAEDAPAEAFIFKYRRVNGVDQLQATYTVPNGPIGQRGVDWLDLGTDQQTFYWTSEGTRIHEFRPAGSPLGATYRTIPIRNEDGVTPFLGTAYAMRALPPRPGDPLQRPSGFLIAMHSMVLRVAYDGPENDNTPQDQDGRIVQRYAPPIAGAYFALNITPDGQSFWTASYQGPFDAAGSTGHLYKFHIASGALLKGPIPVRDMAGTRVDSVWGLCVKREYTAAVNTCFVTDGAGNVVLENGQPVRTACKVPEICNQSGIDDDGDGQELRDLNGDGLPDGFDDDCRNPSVPNLVVADKISTEGELVDGSHPVNTVDPISLVDSDGGPLTVTSVTGLPSFFAWTQTGTPSSATLVFTGTAPAGTVATNPQAGAPGYTIAVVATDGTHEVTAKFLWKIIRANAPLSLSDPESRTCVVGAGCDTQFTLTVSDLDTDDARFTTVALPAGFTHTPLAGSDLNELRALGRTSYPFTVSGPTSFAATGTHTLTLCAVDVPVFAVSPIYPPDCVTWTVTVTNDAPVISVENQFTLLGEADSYTVPTSDPNGHSVTVTSITGVPTGMTVSGATISGTPAEGTYTVTVNAEDEYGLAAAPKTFQWVVSGDNTPPVLNMPPSVTIEATSPAGAPHVFVVTATDTIDGPVAVSCTAASGATFPLGTTTVTCTASDSLDNTASGSFSVTVVDRTAPTGACTPSFNPSTRNIPRASGINEDGFYLVGGTDMVSAPVTITIGSYTLRDGETVKFTQSNGLNGVVFVNYQQGIRHFRVGPSDPVVTFTDAAGNTTSVTCYVPSKPK